MHAFKRKISATAQALSNQRIYLAGTLTSSEKTRSSTTKDGDTITKKSVEKMMIRAIRPGSRAKQPPIPTQIRNRTLNPVPAVAEPVLVTKVCKSGTCKIDGKQAQVFWFNKFVRPDTVLLSG